MRHLRKLLVWCAALIVACLLFGEVGLAANSGTSTTKVTRSSPKSSVTPSEIAQARAKGLVWVNTKSHVYHTGGRYYGKTKHGRFMSLADARKDGYRAAKR